MSRPKVTHITSVHPPFDIRIFHKQCRSLAEAGYEVVLVAPKETDETVEGVRVRGIRKPKSRLLRMAMAWRAVAIALREDAALYHIHDPELLPAAKCLQWLGKPVLYDMHENVPKALLTKPWIPPALRRPVSDMFRGLERVLLGGMGVVFAENSYRDDYPWLARQQIVLNMPPLAALSQVEATRHAKPTVAYLGAVTPERGSTVMLEAMRQLQAAGLDVAWECIGPIYDDHRAALEETVSRHGLQDIRLHGYMIPQEGWQRIAACHVGLALLAPTPNNVDCCSTKIFEYMALGMPLVASNFKTYRQVIEKHGCGLCVDPEDPAAVAAAIRWLVEHPEEARAMGERGRQATAAEYSWETEAAKLLAFYRTLLPEAAAVPSLGYRMGASR